MSASTQNQALSALVFLYRDLLEMPVGWLSAMVRAKRPGRLPVVLTREEVRRVLRPAQGSRGSGARGGTVVWHGHAVTRGAAVAG